MVAPDKLRRLLDVLRDNLADLRQYAGEFSADDLARDRRAQHLVLHAMYLTTQAMLDSAAHILASHRLALAPTYTAVPLRLGEAGLLDHDLAMRLSAWASMRNVLAHFYAVVDYHRVHHALMEDLGDFDDFLVAAEEMLDPR